MWYGSFACFGTDSSLKIFSSLQNLTWLWSQADAIWLLEEECKVYIWTKLRESKKSFFFYYGVSCITITRVEKILNALLKSYWAVSPAGWKKNQMVGCAEVCYIQSCDKYWYLLHHLHLWLGTATPSADEECPHGHSRCFAYNLFWHQMIVELKKWKWQLNCSDCDTRIIINLYSKHKKAKQCHKMCGRWLQWQRVD